MTSILFSILVLIVGYKLAQIIYQKRINNIYRKLRYPQLIKRGVLRPVDIDFDDRLWHEQETDFVFKLHEQLSSAFEPNKVAQYIVETVHKFLYIDKTILLLLDKDGQEFRLGYSEGLEDDIAKNFVLKKTEGISGFVIKEQRPLIVDDLDKEYYLKKINKEDYLKKSFVGIPLLFQNEALGVLYVCEKKPESVFSKRDIAFLINVGKGATIALQNVRLYEQIQKDYLKTMTALAAAIDARDHYTQWHSENVARYSLAIAQNMKFPTSRLEILRRAALLHDIGKIGISDAILLNSKGLSQEEFKEIELHPEIGERIVKSLPFLEEVSILIRHHHERCDGSGYPDKIKKDKIELGARILAVADSFDAIISDRTYHKALLPSEAIEILRKQKGTKFDPEVVDSFLEILEDNPNILQHPQT